MDRDLLRNGSGYVDYTAYQALTNIEKKIEREEKQMEFNRGEIFSYTMNGGDRRKALVISADFRAKDRYISIIVLTEEPKPNSVPITTLTGIMYADCGMVSFATNDRLGNFLQSVNETEMKDLEEGIMYCLGIEREEKVVEVPAKAETGIVMYEAITENAKLLESLATAKAEANVYKELYNNLLAKVMA